MKKKKQQAAEVQPPETEEKKMTIYEYEQKYSKPMNARGAKFLVRFLAAIIGIFLFICLFFVTMKVYDMNEYAGYGVGAVAVLIFIFFYIVPLVRIMRLGHFVTNVNAYNARSAQKHNRKVRRDVAEKIIDFTAKVEGVGWYDSEVVGRLAIAVNTNDEENIKSTLTELYKGCVKKSAKRLIAKSSLKSAAYSAISQAAKVDTVLVIVVNLQLIKDIVFLYGFRPSDARLVKIFARVLQNSLIAYGLGGVSVGNSVVKTMGDAVKGIPLLGSAISAIVDSSIQGLVNGTLTTVIGYQTIRYLNEEYRLQDILDGVAVSETPVELEEACSELETQLKKKKKLAEAS